MKKETKIIKLFKNKGFYILLVLGLGIVGATGYVTNLRNNQNYEVEVSSEVDEPDTVSKISDVPAVSKEETITPIKKAVASTVTASEQKDNKDAKFILPLQGELGTSFSGNDLVFSKTMQDWRVHTGVDIRGDIGSQVKAAANGIITKVYNDEMMGTTIVVQHTNGIETVYSNLQTGELVTTDQEVAKGDIIGGVGMTAPYEISEPPHLHFEVKKDGQFVNPFDYTN